jgi:hypothetical protein
MSELFCKFHHESCQNLAVKFERFLELKQESNNYKIWPETNKKFRAYFGKWGLYFHFEPSERLEGLLTLSRLGLLLQGGSASTILPFSVVDIDYCLWPHRNIRINNDMLTLLAYYSKNYIYYSKFLLASLL